MAYNFCITVDGASTVFSLKGEPEIDPNPPEGRIDEDDYTDILRANNRLFVWLDELSEFCLRHANPEVRLTFRQLYSAPSPDGRFVRWISPGQGGADLAERQQALQLKAHAVFYQALADYLGTGERYVSLGAHLVYLFAAWQAYNLLKSICRDESKWSDDMRLALAGAYTRLNDLLAEPQFQMAARQMAYWARIPDPNDPLLRHRLRRSLIVTFPEDPGATAFSRIGGNIIEYDKPLPAPGFFPPSPKYPETESMHPIFSKTPEGKRAARAMVTRHLLPRYDFDSSLQIARWLKKPSEPRLGSGHKYLLLVVYFLIGFFTIRIGMWFYYSSRLLVAGQPFWITLVEAILFVFAAWVLIVRRFDNAVLIHMTLPRLVGGIVAGFLLFVTQQDSIELVNAFTLDRSANPSDGWFAYTLQSGGGLVALLWLGVLVASWIYLSNDVRPWTIDRRETRRRTFFFILLAVMVSGLVTLFGAAIVLAAYGPSTQPWGKPWLGPFGLFDLRQFITFAPLALIAGMVSQFILEERTLPSPIWASEQD